MIVNRVKASVTKIAGMFFFPGNNVVAEDKEQAIREHADFKAQIDAKYMSIVEAVDEETGKPTDDITKMGAKDAVAVVKECLQIPDLEAMLEVEERKSVIKAINSQIKKLREEAGEGEE